ncbi:MAG: polysaccharide biosynthesis/export family protein [Verrucomicrobiales bacterium]|nr:polysaccharide biosynthesis/export family protein [Verrucomicrobiales bacterium]
MPPLIRHFALGALFLLFFGCKSNEVVDEVPANAYPAPREPEIAETATPSRPAPRPPSRGGAIRPGDTLELFVSEDKSFNGTYSVRERGDIIIPSVGRIPVSGMSVVDAGSRIKSELESSQLKKATVIVDRVGRAPVQAAPPVPVASSTTRSNAGPRVTVYMTGKVARPGQHRIPYPANGSLGVYEAILISGGLSKFADPQKVHLLRTDREGQKHRIPVNIRQIEQGLAKDPPIGEGDIVVVPEKVFGF